VDERVGAAQDNQERIDALLEPLAKGVLAQGKDERPYAGSCSLVDRLRRRHASFRGQPNGGACHTGFRSCFFQQFAADGKALPLSEEKVFDPNKIYGP
jgi:hypothetical protein